MDKSENQDYEKKLKLTKTSNFLDQTSDALEKIIGNSRSQKFWLGIALALFMPVVFLSLLTADLYFRTGVLVGLLQVERNVYEVPDKALEKWLTWAPDQTFLTMPEVPAGYSAQFVRRPASISGGNLDWLHQASATWPMQQAVKEEIVADNCASFGRDLAQALSLDGQEYWFLTTNNRILRSVDGGLTCARWIDQPILGFFNSNLPNFNLSTTERFEALAAMVVREDLNSLKTNQTAVVLIGDNGEVYALSALNADGGPETLGLFLDAGKFVTRKELENLANDGAFRASLSFDQVSGIDTPELQVATVGTTKFITKQFWDFDGSQPTLFTQHALPYFATEPDAQHSEALNSSVSVSLVMPGLESVGDGKSEIGAAASFQNRNFVGETAGRTIELQMTGLTTGEIASRISRSIPNALLSSGIGFSTGLPERGWIRSMSADSIGMHIFLAITEVENVAPNKRPPIYYSEDGGLSYNQLSEIVGPPYAFFLSLPGAVLCFFMAAAAYQRSNRAKERYNGKPGLSAHSNVTDAPIGLTDRDVLGLRRMALGISRVIRNTGTKPPITFGIVGSWGSGKSSMMTMLQQDLESRSGRVIWFNAWHHQSEDHILAALLHAIRQRAVPAVWQTSGILFRLQLLLRRSKQLMNFVMPYTAILLGFFWLYTSDTRLGEKLEAMTENVSEFVNGGLVLLIGIPPIVSLFRLLKPFNFSPASITKNALSLTRVLGMEDKLGTRHAFQKQFGDVTEVMSRTGFDLTLVIDDLDRCSPKNVRMVLEAVNFLTSAGRCYVIVGLDGPRVLDMLEKEFTDEATVGETARDIAERYLRKIINVNVAVPDFSNDKAVDLIQGLVEKTPEEKVSQVIEDYNARIGRRRYRWLWDGLSGLTIIGFLAAVLSFGAISILDGFGERPTLALEDSSHPKVEETEEANASTPEANSTKNIAQQEREGTGDTSSSTAAAPAAPTPETTLPLPVIPLDQGGNLQSTFFGLLIGTLVLIAILYIQDIFNQQERQLNTTVDSNELRDALAEVTPLVQQNDKTPRNVKQFLNYTRLVKECMTSHSDEEGRMALEETAVSDADIVALCAAHRLRPDYVTSVALGESSRTTAILDELKKSGEIELSSLLKEITRTQALVFRNYF